MIGQQLVVMWGQQAIVETKAAAGLLAAEQVVQLPGGGSTLPMTPIDSHALSPAPQLVKLRYNVKRNFSRC